jgi:DNA repair protein RecN (Recombination protein N)
LNTAYKILALNSDKLHAHRATGAKLLSKELTLKIQSLRMNGAEIELKINSLENISAKGSTELNIYAKTNKGEGSYLLKNIASGGELSRILLGLRELISSQDSVTVFLFDEIDTGLGGETALAIGEAIKRVSASSQVIAITHLPQIASYANQLAVVHKEVIGEGEENERTISLIKSYSEKNKRIVINSMNPLPN